LVLFFMLNTGRLLLVVLVGLVWADARLVAQVVADEYRLKAAFMYQFPQFVEWPTGTWREARAVQLCVVEPNPFGSELERLIRGETLNGRPLAAREIYGADDLTGCHVLFVGKRSGDSSAVLKATARRPVLTIGEAEGFLEDGGIIAMKIVDGKVRFEVHAANAQKAGLRISSQLLSLALAVRGGPS
jgi:YfiR/HmsC-like